MQFPTVMGGVVPVVNLEGIKAGEMKLTGTVLADIYLGKITKWNDPAIAALNKGVKLPDHRHHRGAPLRRFRHHLHLHQLSVQGQPGVEDQGRQRHLGAVAWPSGTGGKGNEGVATFVQRIKGSIGYVEYAYAKQNKMTYALLQNRDGNFVKPDDEAFKAAAANADWEQAPGFYEILTDEPGKDSWPITGATFILMHKMPGQAGTGQGSAEVLRLGLHRTATRWRWTWITFRMPDAVVKLIHDDMERPDQGRERQAGLVRLVTRAARRS